MTNTNLANFLIPQLKDVNMQEKFKKNIKIFNSKTHLHHFYR